MIDNLDSDLVHLKFGGLFVERRSRAMNWAALLAWHRTHFVHRLPKYVEHAAKCLFADGHADGFAEVDGLHPADHTVGRLKRDGADSAFPDMLGDFAGDIQRLRHVVALAGNADCGTDKRNVAFLELDVDGGSRDLDDFSYVHKIPSLIEGGSP